MYQSQIAPLKWTVALKKYWVKSAIDTQFYTVRYPAHESTCKNLDATKQDVTGDSILYCHLLEKLTMKQFRDKTHIIPILSVRKVGMANGLKPKHSIPQDDYSQF